jgi:hypothetical protein
MLYWAEGAKSRNVVKLVNSDPNMVRIFRRFLVQALDASREQIRFSINVYTGTGSPSGRSKTTGSTSSLFHAVAPASTC